MLWNNKSEGDYRMGFFQDLRQDLSQTVTDMNAEETVGDIDLDTDIPT